MARPILVEILGDASQFNKELDRASGRTKKIGVAGKVAGGLLAGGLAVGLEESVKAAVNAQKSQARLETAFKTAKLSASQYRDQVEQLEKSGRKLGFTDESTKNAVGSLLVATKSMSAASRDLSVAQDIARFKNVDLETATKTLTMAMGGSQRAAKQLGLSVQAVTTEQDKARGAFNAAKDAINAHFDAIGKLSPAEEKEKQAALDNAKAHYDGAKATAQVADKQVTAAKVIDLVSQKLHGQADAYSKTAAGSMAQFNAETEHLKVAVGTHLLPVLTKTVDALNQMVGALERVNTWMAKIGANQGLLDILKKLAANQKVQAVLDGISAALRAIGASAAYASDQADRLHDSLERIKGPSGIDVARGVIHKVRGHAGGGIVGKGYAKGGIVPGYGGGGLIGKLLGKVIRHDHSHGVPVRVHWNKALQHWIFEQFGDRDKRNPQIPFWKDLPTNWFTSKTGSNASMAMALDAANWWHKTGWKTHHGFATGGIAASDTVPAMLTPGEMVLNRAQQNMLGGQGFLSRLFGFAGGGLVPGGSGGGLLGAQPTILQVVLDGKVLGEAIVENGKRQGKIYAARNARPAF